MDHRADLYVLPHPKGGWQVRRHAAAKASGRISVDNGEVIAAIALAVKLHKAEQHDHESDVITINRVARVYSPWSSKIHGLTPTPERK